MATLKSLKELLDSKPEDMLAEEPFDFQTVEEAEEYYYTHLAQTNNMHDEETSRLERWLDTKTIDETND